MATLASSDSLIVPPCIFAQRSDTLYVTLEVPDIVKDSVEIKLTDTSLYFKGNQKNAQGEKAYECELKFFKPIKTDDEKTKYKVNDRNVSFHLVKAEDEEDYWPRLLEDKALSKRYCKIDWNKWVDDDEDQTEFDTGAMSGMPPGMGGMGGMPGMGGMGGMPGMGGMGGMGGMDLASMMGGMGGMPGMGGGAPGGAPGGMDMAALQKMMASMKGAGGGPTGGPGDEEAAAEDGPDSDDDDDLPDLEEIETAD